MKTLEEIQKEYQKYDQQSMKLSTPEDLDIYAEIIRDDMLDDITIARREQASNNRRLSVTRVISKLFPVYEEEVEYYERDNKLLQEECLLGLEWRHYLEVLQKEVTPDNLREFGRLLDFSKDYYHSNANFLESKRDELELAFKGIMSFNGKFSDTREVFQQFFSQKISELTTKKDIQKKKEI